MAERSKQSTEAAVREIRRRTRRKFAPEEKIRIVLEGLRGEQSISELCRREGIASNLYYRWSKDFLGARQEPRGIAGTIGPARAQPEGSPESRTGWRSRQSGATPSPRSNFLIYGRIQGICAAAGSAGLAIWPDSAPCAVACLPRSLP